MKFTLPIFALLAATAIAAPTTIVARDTPSVNDPSALVNKLIGLGLKNMSNDELEAELHALGGGNVPAAQLEQVKQMLAQADANSAPAAGTNLSKRAPLHGDCSFIGVFTAKCYFGRRDAPAEEKEVIQKRWTGDCSFFGLLSGKCHMDDIFQ